MYVKNILQYTKKHVYVTKQMITDMVYKLKNMF